MIFWWERVAGWRSAWPTDRRSRLGLAAPTS
jgi:hypothetical protein